MVWLDVYRAEVTIGRHIRGEIYSYHPMPDGEYPLPRPDGGELPLHLSRCTRYVIAAPDYVTLYPNNISGDAATDPDRPDDSVRLGPRVVLDRSQRAGEAFQLLRIYWQYGKNREAVDRFETHLRTHAGAELLARAEQT